MAQRTVLYKNGTDPSGGNNRYLEHIEQLLSVPYAFHANTAEEVLGPADPFYIGQDTMGGIVYYLYKDSSGTQRGFIIEAHDTTGIQYGPSIPQNSSVWDGAFNKQHIPFGQLYYYLQTRNPDWYLPSADELILLKNNCWVVQKALAQNGYSLLGGDYITSTAENHPSMLALFSLQYISGVHVFNQNNYKIRLIKAF